MNYWKQKAFVKSGQKMMKMPGLGIKRLQALFMGIKTIWQ